MINNSKNYLIVQFLTIIISYLGFFFFFKFIETPSSLGSKSSGIDFYIFCLIAIISNFGIIFYHATEPPHPKFLMTSIRKFWVRVHAITGSIEVVLGVTAWLTNNTTLAFTVGLIALFGHIPSSFFQSKGAFGAKGITVPAYYGIVTLHMFCAYNLVLSNGDVYWLEKTWIALQAYAYMRIFMILLDEMSVFKGSRYTVTELLAGAVITPFILGYFGPLMIMIVVMIYLFLFKILLKPSKSQWSDLFEEKERKSLIDRETRDLWISKNIGLNLDENYDSFKTAKKVFDYIDKNNSGFLSLGEIQSIGLEWGLNDEIISSVFSADEYPKGLDFKSFLNTLWLIGGLRDNLTKHSLSSIKNEEERSRVVFDHLDIDQSGFIELQEIHLLLTEWGLTYKEAEKYIKKFGGKDQKIDHQEFYLTMSPIWKFAYTDLFNN